MNFAAANEIAAPTPRNHQCLVYRDTAEQFACVLPFLREGLKAGERCLYIVDDLTGDDVVRELAAGGVEVDREIEQGSLRLLTKRDAYLRSGVFEPKAMIDQLLLAMEDAEAAGFTGLRITGEMTWALGQDENTDRLIEYEALVNKILPGSKALALCQYNRTRFPPGTIRQVLRTHPVAAVGYRVCRNLFYEPPDAVLGKPSEAQQLDWMIACLERSHDAEQELRISDSRLQEAQQVSSVRRDRNSEAKELAEQSVRRSEANYRALVEHATYGIYRASVEGKFLAVNPALVEMLGYESAEDLLAVSIDRDVYCDPTARAALLGKYAHAERIDGVEVAWKRKDGSPITLRLSGRPVHDDKGEPECFEMIVQDVTEQRKLEAQLRQAQKMEAVGLLTGGIAHDFNNLLTVVQANADLLADLVPAESVQLREHLKEIQVAAQHGSSLIRKLSGFSRHERLQLQPLDVGDLVTGLCEMLRRVLPESIEMQCVCGEGAGAARVDRSAVEQILLNLATNARDAMPEGGKLAIGTERTKLDYHATHPWVRPGEFTCITVSDTGVGMDQETKQRIFEPFYTTKPVGRGTGLGMAMIYGLVKQLGGYVHVYSELGKGTTVRVYFPITQEEARAEAREVERREILGGSETVLVVEDEPAIRRASKRTLESAGYTVLLAADGEEGLEVLQRNQSEIDLVICDLVMPRLDGRQFYEALRKRGITVSVLFSSGYSADDVRQANVLEPGTAFIQKPWTLNDFLWRVREMLDQVVSTGEAQP